MKLFCHPTIRSKCAWIKLKNLYSPICKQIIYSICRQTVHTILNDLWNNFSQFIWVWNDTCWQCSFRYAFFQVYMLLFFPPYHMHYLNFFHSSFLFYFLLAPQHWPSQCLWFTFDFHFTLEILGLHHLYHFSQHYTGIPFVFWPLFLKILAWITPCSPSL